MVTDRSLFVGKYCFGRSKFEDIIFLTEVRWPPKITPGSNTCQKGLKRLKSIHLNLRILFGAHLAWHIEILLIISKINQKKVAAHALC